MSLFWPYNRKLMVKKKSGIMTLEDEIQGRNQNNKEKELRWYLKKKIYIKLRFFNFFIQISNDVFHSIIFGFFWELRWMIEFFWKKYDYNIQIWEW